MVLYIIGLGMGTEEDITLRGLNAVKSCTRVYLEAYTSILCVGKEKLEALYGKEVTLASREMVESESDTILENADKDNVAMLVVGDPVCATTHTDIMIRARELNIPIRLIHNASVMGAAGACGLHLYNYGATVSVPFYTEGWRPRSFWDKVAYNRKGGMHTLALLDIKTREPDFEALAKGRKVYLPPRFMTVNTALEQMLEASDEKGDVEGNYNADTLCVGMARLGQDDQCIKVGSIEELIKEDFGEPLHCLVVCADDVHELEMEAMKCFLVKGSRYEK